MDKRSVKEYIIGGNGEAEGRDMRIGMMADVYKPHVSGITNYISLNKEWLEKKGHDVFVFTFGDDDYQDEEKNVIRSPGLPLMKTGYYLGLRYTPQALKILKSMDVVHVHHPFLSGTLALRYCRPRGIPVIFTNHTRYDLYARAYLPVLGEVVGEPALETFMPVFCKTVDLVISPSQGMKEILQRFGVTSEIVVVPNGVDIRSIRAGIQPANRNEFGYDDNHVVLIYVGRLGPEKNIPFLLRSVAGASQAYENIRLLIVGDGPEKQELMELVNQLNISSVVHFTGMVPYEKVHCYLSMADIFVTASVTEVHPLSVIEAMAVGLPVVGIHSPGISDSIEDGVTGYLVREEDLAAYTAKLVKLISQPEQRRVMGKNAQAAAENFAIENTCERMIELYQMVIQKKAMKRMSFSVRVRRLFDSLGSLK